MKLLVIGGTVFVGRATVEAALARGDEVTIFHRGQHGAELFGEVERIVGDRRTDLDKLAGRQWDTVVDTCGFEPQDVAASAQALDVGLYVFVSTAGVYRDWPALPIASEEAPLHQTGDGYSELKAACERAAEAALPGRVACVRPGVIVGPHENIGRLPWWLQRMERGGRVLAPGPAEAPMQLIDARDLADFMLGLSGPGAYNAISPPGAFTWSELLRTARDVVNPEAELVWADGHAVATALDDPWSQLPMWPAPVAGLGSVYGVASDRAEAAGLRTRPLQETITDTWAWLSDGGTLDEWRSELRAVGLDPERERALRSAGASRLRRRA